MKTAPKKNLPAVIFILSISFFFSSCATQDANQTNSPNGSNQNADANQTAENSASTRDNAEALSMVVKMPFEPEEVVWREEPLGKNAENSRLPSQNEKKLTAVLLFKQEDAEKIAAQAQNYKQPVPADIAPEGWFPAELVAQSQLSGDETIKGTTYAANDFFQTPYLDGKLTRIQASNYFVLELIAK